MALSHDVISQFAKIVNKDKKQSSESTIYGKTVVDEQGNKYVQPDGSDQLIPISENYIEDGTEVVAGSTSSNISDGDRVSVLIKDHTATVTGNISSPSASNKDIDNKIKEFDTIIADRIQANTASLKLLISDKASIGDLEVAEGKIAELESGKASIEQLEATNAEITNLKSTKIDADVVEATYATIESLNATDAKVGSMDAEIADINTLMFGSATGSVLQTTFANAVIALLGDAQIKSAMIESLNASKINAGSINTSNVKMESKDGKLVISDNTIQISDGTNVRVQIGKDASDDYSINIWDAEGNLMFSEGGITDSAIKQAIIRNDMVSDEANIDAKKLNISSLFREINDSTETIKSTKVYFDSQKQTLDVAFNEMSTTITEQGETITSQGTDISAIQGDLKSKVWQQDFDTATEAQNTKYSELKQDLDGFKVTVSETYSTKEELNTTSNDINQTIASRSSMLSSDISSISATVSSMESSNKAAIDGLNNSISDLRKEVELKVTDEAVQIEIQKVVRDGVTKVDTGTGITFDENGMTVDKTNSETSTTISENGMVIVDNFAEDEAAKKVLTVDKDGVNAKNLHATTYLIIGGRSRFENYGSNGNNRTGCFWIGE